MKLSKHTQNIKKMWSFTLVEMVIVLLIIGILTMLTMWLSGDQINKVQDKTVKESFISEWQSRYSRNVWSSSFAGKMYEYMDLSLSWWANQLWFHYQMLNSEDSIDNTFSDKFVISGDSNTTIRYTPYNIKCEWWKKDSWWDIDTWDMKNGNLKFMINVRDSRNYCFEINQNNCRLIEIDCEENN